MAQIVNVKNIPLIWYYIRQSVCPRLAFCYKLANLPVASVMKKICFITLARELDVIKIQQYYLLLSQVVPDRQNKLYSIIKCSSLNKEWINALTNIYMIGSWAQCYRTFLSVINKFSYKGRVFVRLDRKSLLATSTLAYYKNS